jgi:hypothetical protein
MTIANAATVTGASVIAGITCFILYIVTAALDLLKKPDSATQTATHQAVAHLVAKPEVSIDDVTKLAEALSKLTDSLSKAGPALTSLIGAIFFMAIAALSSGALKSGASADTSSAPVTASQ